MSVLWDRVFSGEPPRNAAPLLIDEKLVMNDGLFFVARLPAVWSAP